MCQMEMMVMVKIMALFIKNLLMTIPLARQQTTEYSQSLTDVVMVIIPIL